MSDHPDTVSLPKGTADLWGRAAATLDKLLGNPDTAPAVEEAILKVNPDARFPAREQREAIFKPVNERVEQIAKEFKDYRDQTEAAKQAESDRQTEAKLLERLTSTRSKYGFNEETMQRVMERMKDNNNPDVESAAAWVNEQIPKPAPQAGSNLFPQHLDVYGTQSKDEKYRSLHENPSAYFDNEVRAILNDPSLRAA